MENALRAELAAFAWKSAVCWPPVDGSTGTTNLRSAPALLSDE